jgi:hypothetical protein
MLLTKVMKTTTHTNQGNIMGTEDFTTATVVRHTHTYKLSSSRPADTMAIAEADAADFWDADLSPEAELFSDTVIKVTADSATGEMFAYWIQGGSAEEAPHGSKAETTNTSLIHMYTLGAEHATSSRVRAALNKAEQDAKEYAEANDLEFNEDLVALSHDGEQIVVMWSTESDN